MNHSDYIQCTVAIDGLRWMEMKTKKIADDAIFSALFTQYNPTLHTSEASI